MERVRETKVGRERHRVTEGKEYERGKESETDGQRDRKWDGWTEG